MLNCFFLLLLSLFNLFKSIFHIDVEVKIATDGKKKEYTGSEEFSHYMERLESFFTA